MNKATSAERAVQSPAETLMAGQLMVRAFAASCDEPQRLAVARAFGYHLVRAWWSALTAAGEHAPLRAPWHRFETTELPQSVEALAGSLGEAAAQLEAEAAAYQIGLAYTGMLPREHRGTLGIYYTPPILTERLVQQASEAGVDWTRCRVLDPACGGGAFLAPVAQRIRSALSGCSPRILIENIATRLRGYEVDPFGAWLSQVTLDAVLLPVTRAAGRRLPVVVTVCDSLREPPPCEGFDLVIGNPPYGRVKLDAADRERFKRSLFGHANLYGLFTDVALRHTKVGGVVAYVTPTSFLAGEYFKNLRALLGRSAPPLTVDFVSVRKGVFDDVLQETVLATYRRGSGPSLVAVHEITPTNGAGSEIAATGAVPLPSDPSKPWILPRKPAQTPLVERLASMTHRLADWGYTVSTGPLVWNRFKDQLADSPGHGRYPLIWAESVTSDGRFVWRAERRNHRLYFEVRSGDDWLVARRRCVLLQRTTAKEQPRRLIAAALPAHFLDRHKAVVVENHLNMLRPISERPAISADVLATFLNSRAIDRAFRCVSGSVAVSAYEIEALPLPGPEELEELARLIRDGAGAETIEAKCMRLYDGSA